jgi:hypothetical protein
MRFYAILFVLALVAAVSAMPKNVPQIDPQAVVDFQSEQNPSVKERRMFEDLGPALSSWLSSPVTKVRSNILPNSMANTRLCV